MLHRYLVCAGLTAAAMLSGCGGDDNSVPVSAGATTTSTTSTPSTGTGPRFLADISVPGVTAGTNFSFDIAAVVGPKFFFTDRTNSAVDFVFIPTKTVGMIKGSGANTFAGPNASNSKAGPDGLIVADNLLFAGDVNSVKVIQLPDKTLTRTIAIPNATGVRADEGCYDPVHKIVMISSPEEPTPFATFIDVTTLSVVSQVTFTDAAGQPSAGLEACEYDSATDSFFVNNDGTTANPHGELIRMTGASIRAIPNGGKMNYTALANVAMYPEGNCDPTGLALGPNNDIAVGCREATTGAPLLLQIFDKTNGTLLKSLNAGGGDQLVFDQATKRYYNAASRWTASGNAATDGTCSATSPCTPVLFVVDAVARTIVTSLPTGNNAHSVAVDPATGLIFVPYSSATAPAGCANCATNKFVNGGISVFSAT